MNNEEQFIAYEGVPQLTWKYEKADSTSVPSIGEDNQAELVLPTAEDLQILLKLTRDGSLSKLMKTAEEIGLHGDCLPFTHKVVYLAKQCELEKIEELLQESLGKGNY